MRSNDIVLAVQGKRGLGKKLLLQMAAAHWNQRLVVIDSKRLSHQHPQIQQMTVRSLARARAPAARCATRIRRCR